MIYFGTLIYILNRSVFNNFVTIQYLIVAAIPCTQHVINNSLNNIGIYYTLSSVINISSATDTIVMSQEVPQGYYMVVAVVYFKTGSSTGIRQAALSSGVIQRAPALTTGDWAILNVSDFLAVSSGTYTLQLKAYQNSGGYCRSSLLYESS